MSISTKNNETIIDGAPVTAPDGVAVRDAREELIPHLEKLGIHPDHYEKLRVVEYGDGSYAYDFGELPDETLRDEALYCSLEKVAQFVYESIFPEPD